MRGWNNPQDYTDNILQKSDIVNRVNIKYIKEKSQASAGEIQSFPITLTDSMSNNILQKSDIVNREKGKELAAKTMYKKEGGEAADEFISSLIHTSETAPSTATIVPVMPISVSPSAQNVNRYNYQGNQSQTGCGGTARGAYSNNIIYLFEHADASTVIHELGHYFLDDLQKYGKSEKSQQQLQAIYNYLGAKDGVITNEMHEYFADSFEVYLKEGKAPNSLLRGVFIKFKNWLRRIFSEVKRLELVATHFLFVELTARPFAVQRICRV